MKPTVPDWRAARAAAEQKALSRIKDDTALAAALPALIDALGRLLTLDPQDDGAFPATLQTTAAASLRHAGCADWADALKELVEIPHTVDARLIAAAFVIAQAVGELCGRRPHEPELRLGRRVLDAFPDGFNQFSEAFEAALRRTPGAPETLAATLLTRVRNFSTAPYDVAHSYAFRSAADYHQQPHRLLDLWEDPPYGAAVLVHDSQAYSLLRHIDPASYLAVLEALPHPALARQIVDTAARTSPLTELCALLRRAKPAFGGDGTWLADRKAAVLLLAGCTGRLAEIAAPSPNDDGKPGEAIAGDAAIDAAMTEILAALKARTDAVPLGYAWLQYLIWSGRARRRWRPQATPPDAPPAQLLTVISRLGAWLPFHPAPEQWVADEGDVWRNDRIYALLAVAASRDPVDGAKIRDLINALVTRDLVSTVGLDRLPTGASHDLHIVAVAVAAIPETATWFKDLWAKIFHLRDRVRRFRYPHHDIPPNVGQVAVLWGLCGLGSLDLASQAARDLWTALELATRESSLTDAIRLPNDPWSIAARWLGAYWPRIFSNDPAAGSPGALDDFLSYLIAPDMGFALLMLELRKAGATAAQLARSIPDATLLRRAADDLQRLGRGMPKSEAVLAIEALADEIDNLARAP